MNAENEALALSPKDETPFVMMTAEQANQRLKEAEVTSPRITLVGNFHYQDPGEQPETIAFAFDDLAESKADSYQRKLTVNGSVALDFQWVRDPGWFWILNTDKEKPVFFGSFEIPPKGIFFGKLRKGAPLPDLEADDVKVQLFACER